MKKLITICLVTALVAGTANATITFSEFPAGTAISNQYAGQGVIFSPGNITQSLPIIAADVAIPSTPVLSPQPIYAGDFWMQITVSTNNVQFLSGYWDTIGTGIIDVYDPGMNFLTSLSNTTTGLELISITGLGDIGYIHFNSLNDPAGGDIDNLMIPEPATTALLGLGSLVLLKKRNA